MEEGGGFFSHYFRLLEDKKCEHYRYFYLPTHGCYHKMLLSQGIAWYSVYSTLQSYCLKTQCEGPQQCLLNHCAEEVWPLYYKSYSVHLWVAWLDQFLVKGKERMAGHPSWRCCRYDTKLTDWQIRILIVLMHFRIYIYPLKILSVVLFSVVQILSSVLTVAVSKVMVSGSFTRFHFWWAFIYSQCVIIIF